MASNKMFFSNAATSAILVASMLLLLAVMMPMSTEACWTGADHRHPIAVTDLAKQDQGTINRIVACVFQTLTGAKPNAHGNA
jgi:hypothetical protein